MTDSDAKSVDLSALRIERDRNPSAPGKSRKWLRLLWLLVPVILYFAYQITIKKVTPAIPVQIATAQYVTGSEASAELVATGYVVAQRKAAVSSKATGRLKILNVEEGDQVKSGDILAQLENDDIKANLASAQANLKLARSDSTGAALNYFRQKELIKSGSTTQEFLDIATTRFESAVANLEAKSAELRATEVALENTLIRAPFNGTVLTKEADVGEMVAPFASSSSSRGSVVTIADMNSLEVEADVSESNIYKVKINQPCEIILDAYPDHRYHGHVKKIVPTADRSRATVLTKVAFTDKDERVLPEMSARVNFLPVAEKKTDDSIQPVLAVPKSALTSRADQKVVFKVAGEYVQATPVETGRELGTVTEIKSGLQKGDKVVLSPPGNLKSGDKIKLQTN